MYLDFLLYVFAINGEIHGVFISPFLPLNNTGKNGGFATQSSNAGRE